MRVAPDCKICRARAIERAVADVRYQIRQENKPQVRSVFECRVFNRERIVCERIRGARILHDWIRKHDVSNQAVSERVLSDLSCARWQKDGFKSLIVTKRVRGNIQPDELSVSQIEIRDRRIIDEIDVRRR